MTVEPADHVRFGLPVTLPWTDGCDVRTDVTYTTPVPSSCAPPASCERDALAPPSGSGSVLLAGATRTDIATVELRDILLYKPPYDALLLSTFSAVCYTAYRLNRRQAPHSTQLTTPTVRRRSPLTASQTAAGACQPCPTGHRRCPTTTTTLPTTTPDTARCAARPVRAPLLQRYTPRRTALLPPIAWCHLLHLPTYTLFCSH